MRYQGHCCQCLGLWWGNYLNLPVVPENYQWFVEKVYFHRIFEEPVYYCLIQEPEYHQWLFVAKVCFHWVFEELEYYQWFVAKVHFH